MGVDVKRQGLYVYIEGLPLDIFINDIKQMYQVESLKEIPLFSYSDADIINKGIFYIKVHHFFLPEIYNIFTKLYEETSRKIYLETLDVLGNKTWLTSLKKEVPPIDKTKFNELKRQPRQYQASFIDYYYRSKIKLELRGAILAFEQGLGKTFTALASSYIINNEQVLIICPKSLIGTWDKEIREVMPGNINIGVVGEDPPNTTAYNYIICNYERVEKAYDYIGNSVTLLIDESHNIRFMKTTRATQLYRLRIDKNIQDIIVMSGTPIKALASELIPILALLDDKFDYTAMKIFQKVYGEYREAAYHLLQYRMSIMMDRKLKTHELKNLPPKYFQNINLKVSNSNEYTIEKIRSDIEQYISIRVKELKHDLESYFQTFIDLSFLCYRRGFLKKDEFEYMQTAMRNFYNGKFELDVLIIFKEYYQKCYIGLSNIDVKKRNEFRTAKVTIFSPISRAFGEAMGKIFVKRKIEASTKLFVENVDKILDMVNKAIKKTIIFSSSVIVLKEAQKILNEKKIPHVLITGETKNIEDELTRFKTDPEIKILLASLQKLSTGVTLTQANQEIFLDMPYRDADYQQATDRTHRIGQDTNVYIINLFVDTGDKPNITTHSRSIMEWSAKVSTAVLNFLH